ncbi:MAG: hypothetical protein KDG55_04965 [Rhodocyclaceae bacterium]|nr:hypothetical protein [Rhodocyclaceae bacterium]
MTRRIPDELVVARWTVPPKELRTFAGEIRSRYGDTPFAPIDVLKMCEKHDQTGLDVVCRDDAVFVGEWRLAFLYNQITAITVEDTWLRFEMEGGLYEIPVPISTRQRSLAQRAVEHYTRLAEEESSRAREQRAAPTWQNRLLNIAEAHAIWLILGVLFVGIPAIILIVGLLRGGFQ